MKLKLVLFLALLLFGGVTAKANIAYDNDIKKEVVVVTQDKSNYDRSQPDFITVFYLPLSSEIEVNCTNEGHVSVYLFNSRNQMCGYAEYDSAETPVERLDVPKQSGTYHIAIITDKSYSEGSFTK